MFMKKLLESSLKKNQVAIGLAMMANIFIGQPAEVYFITKGCKCNQHLLQSIWKQENAKK